MSELARQSAIVCTPAEMDVTNLKCGQLADASPAVTASRSEERASAPAAWVDADGPPPATLNDPDG